MKIRHYELSIVKQSIINSNKISLITKCYQNSIKNMQIIIKYNYIFSHIHLIFWSAIRKYLCAYKFLFLHKMFLFGHQIISVLTFVRNIYAQIL